jgi:hypothetical protein
MVQVVFIVGKGRSGSTLLDQMLGSTQGWFSAGELFRLWDWGVRDHVACACGAPVPRCPVWSAVLAEVGIGSGDVDEVLSWRDDALTWRSAPRVLVGRPGPEARAWNALMGRTYGAIRAATGAEVVVDSSKWPTNPGILGTVGGIDPHVVHLVRDPRAVAHSWRRRKRFQDRDAEMPRFSAASSALSWDAKNLAALATRRRRTASSWTTVRYEDLAAAPAETLDTILAACSRGSDRRPRLERGELVVGELHTIGGNPSKGANTHLSISADHEWRSGISPRTEAITTFLCAPLMWRFGYRVRRAASPAPR